MNTSRKLYPQLVAQGYDFSVFQLQDDCSDNISILSSSVFLSTRIKDAGIAVRHSRGRILFYSAGSRNGLEGVDTVCPGTQKQVDPKKRHVFVIEKYIEDVKQSQKVAPDLVESIMRPSDHVKEESRRNLYKMSQFSPK